MLLLVVLLFFYFSFISIKEYYFNMFCEVALWSVHKQLSKRCQGHTDSTTSSQYANGFFILQVQQSQPS